MNKKSFILVIVALLIAFSSAVYANSASMTYDTGEEAYLLSCNFSNYTNNAYEYVIYKDGVNVSSGISVVNGTHLFNSDVESNFFLSSGSFQVGQPMENFVDENPATYAHGTDNDAAVRVYYNFSYVLNATWYLSANAVQRSVALPQYCTNQSSIELNVYANEGLNWVNAICRNQTDLTWSPFLLVNIAGHNIFEENISITANYSAFPSEYNANVLNYSTVESGSYVGGCRALNADNTTEKTAWVNGTGRYITGNWTIEFLDEDTQNRIDDETITLEIVADSFSEIYTVTTGLFDSPISALILNLTLPINSEFELRYATDTRLLRSSFFTATDTPLNITLYMLNDTTSDQLDVIVRDFSLIGIEGAYITAERWYTNISQYVAIAEGKTNNLGSTRFYLHKDNAYYRFLVEYNNITIFTSGGEIIPADIDTYRINTDTSSVYTAWSDLSGDMTYSNSTGTPTFSFTYEGKLDNIDSVTIEMYINNSIGDLVLNGSNSSTATDDTITLKVTDIESYYVAFVYITYTSGDFAYLDNEYKEFFPRLTSTQEDWLPIILFISIILFPALVLGLLASIKKLIAIPIAVALFVLIMSFNPFFVLFPRVIATLIIFGCIFIAYYLNKNTV